MNKCKLCQEEFADPNINNIISRNIMIKLEDGTLICNGCNDAMSFMNDINKEIIVKPKIIKKSNKTKSDYLCMNKDCNEIYCGSVCPNCKKPNPLFIRKTKKKKKKKKRKNLFNLEKIDKLII
jgi:hypothetical protein